MLTRFPVWCCAALLVVSILGAATAEAKIKISCIDSDGGLNLQYEGEVTVMASLENKILMQRSFRDRNWLGKKKYIEFYCDEAAEFPLYKFVNCDSSEAAGLPASACPSAKKGGVMLEARHASVQPKAILESRDEIRPYYKLSLSAPVDNVSVKAIRFQINLGGLVQGSNTAMRVTEFEKQETLKNTMLAWDKANPSQATGLLQLDPPLKLTAGSSKTLTLWLQNLIETPANTIADNQVSVTIENIELEDYTNIYFESKPQVNTFLSYE
jgi:hypothetical protein